MKTIAIVVLSIVVVVLLVGGTVGCNRLVSEGDRKINQFRTEGQQTATAQTAAASQTATIVQGAQVATATHAFNVQGTQAANASATASAIAATQTTQAQNVQATANAPRPTQAPQATQVIIVQLPPGQQPGQTSGTAPTATPVPQGSGSGAVATGNVPAGYSLSELGLKTAKPIEAEGKGQIGWTGYNFANVPAGACVDYDPRSGTILGDHHKVFTQKSSARVLMTGKGSVNGDVFAIYWTPCTE